MNRQRMRGRTALIGRWLALALLVGQFGAEIHLYSHRLADPSDFLGASRNCGTCLASTQLQNAVGTAPPALPVRTVAWVTVVAATAVRSIPSAPFRAYRTRAPPTPV